MNMERLTYRPEDQWGNPTNSALPSPLYSYHEEKTRKAILYKLAEYEDLEEQNRLIILPCAEGSTIYKITKFCGRTKGYREEYKPFVEFERKCEFYERSLFYGEKDKCIAKIDDPYKEPWWCSYNLDILCETCKSRIAIQKDAFTLPKLTQVYNTPAFNPNTDPENIFYLTYEEAEMAMKKLIGEE